VSVGRRVFPVLLTIAAAVFDGHGSHGLARDALLGAVPFAAVAALLAFGEYLEAREDAVVALQALLWGVATTLLVVSCAARSPEAATHTLPPLGRSALIGCLGVFAVKASVAAVQQARRLVLRPAKP
jgi:hypothetical protein